MSEKPNATQSEVQFSRVAEIETETIDRLFLELSQVTRAKTRREQELEADLTAANHDLLDSLHATAEALVQAESERNGAELLRDQAKKDLAELRSRPPIVAAQVGSYVLIEVREPMSEVKVGEYYGDLEGDFAHNGIHRVTMAHVRNVRFAIYRRIEPGEHGAFTHVLEDTGEVRDPQAGEWFLGLDGLPSRCITDALAVPRKILRLIPIAPPAEPADDGFEKWWETLPLTCGMYGFRSVDGRDVFIDEARAIWTAARQAQEKE